METGYALPPQSTHRVGFSCFEDLQPQTCLSKTALALGIITLLGSLFLLLAAHQVLPHGVNAISQLGTGGCVACYGSAGLGAFFMVLGAVGALCTQRTGMSRSGATRIPEAMHPTFEALFADWDKGLDGVPAFGTVLSKFPGPQEMEHSVMQGEVISPLDPSSVKPFIAIKVVPEASSKGEREHVLILYPHIPDCLLSWYQFDISRYAPLFFPGQFTDMHTGRIKDDSLDRFNRLKALVNGNAVQDERNRTWILA